MAQEEPRHISAIAGDSQSPGEPGGEEIADDGARRSPGRTRADQLGPFGLLQSATSGQVAQVLHVPEHERPVGGQRAGADEDGQHGGAADRRRGTGRRCPAARRRRPRAWPACHSSARGRDGGSRRPAAPAARRPGRRTRGWRPASKKFARTPAARRCSRRSAAPRRSRPASAAARFRTAARPDGPFPADAQRGQEAEDQQLPPSLGEEGQAGEQGVGEDGQRQRPAAAETIADPPKEPAAQRPAEEEGRLDPERSCPTAASLFAAASSSATNGAATSV